ncbi:TetR family transcriptional regulator, partial [Streptomyces durbertensis]
MTGLRERKKLRTRNALIRTAHELFLCQGYERTTVEEIATSASVSERTFFRYFAGKEDVVFVVQETVQARYLARFAARPAEEPPLVALRNAMDEGWQEIGATIAEIVPPDVYLRMWQLIETTPTLSALQLGRSQAMEEELADAVARRVGVDLAEDPRPRVLVAAFCGVLRTAMHVWGSTGNPDLDSARRQAGEYLDLLPGALSEDWG